MLRAGTSPKSRLPSRARLVREGLLEVPQQEGHVHRRLERHFLAFCELRKMMASLSVQVFGVRGLQVSRHMRLISERCERGDGVPSGPHRVHRAADGVCEGHWALPGLKRPSGATFERPPRSESVLRLWQDLTYGAMPLVFASATSFPLRPGTLRRKADRWCGF